MPIFARRRLQSMINDLANHLSPVKSRSIINRIEHKNTKDSIAAEIELGLLWGVSRVANLTIEPELSTSTARPDAFSDNLFPHAPALIEITAVSDDTFSGKDKMERAANIICAHANGIRKGSGNHLYFDFSEENRLKDGFRRRTRRITDKFNITDKFSNELNQWLGASDWPNVTPIRLTDEEIDVIIQWKPYVHPHGRTHSSMPPVADHLEDNPVFKALRKKEKQLSKSSPGMLKCIFIGDAGCQMLRELKPLGYMDIRGGQVIHHFLRKSKVDIVIVFSPHRKRAFFLGQNDEINWRVTVFDGKINNDLSSVYGKINELLSNLPPPQLESYQVRSRHQQGMLDIEYNNFYKGTIMTSKMAETSFKISTKLILNLLSGKITQEEFHFYAFGNDINLIRSAVDRGMSVNSAHMEQSGVDADDDYLILNFGPDWAIRRLQVPEVKD